MDPVLTPALVTTALSKLFDSAAAEAGTKAWDALKTLLTRHHGATPTRPVTAEEASTLAEQLVAAAETDPSFARDLADWQQSVSGSDNVANIVTGQVRHLVQGRDFNDTTITFN